jgi:hypothetical protein
MQTNTKIEELLNSELLCELLEVAVIQLDAKPLYSPAVKGNELWYWFINGVSNKETFIDIDSLTKKCKVWSEKHGYFLKSFIDRNQGRCEVYNIATSERQVVCQFDMEAKAVFKAMQWVHQQVKAS